VRGVLEMTGSSGPRARVRSGPVPTDFYSIPDLYDVLHAPGTAEEVDVLRAIQRRAVGRVRTPRWLEPASGTGRYLLEAARQGVACVGFDMSAPMVKYARARAARRSAARRPRFYLADMRDFDEGRRLGAFDFAFNPINTIRHLGSDAAMRQHLRAMARVMHPHGVYAVGISLCAYGAESPTEDVWHGERGALRVVQVVQYMPPAGGRGEASRTERVFSHLTVTRRGEERHVDSSYALRGYDLSQWTALTARAGWTIDGATDSHGEPATPREPGYFIFLLRPPTG
jgi:SAM-dependent methyltransferase